MTSFINYAKKLDRVADELERTQVEEYQKIANDDLALKKQRIISTGKDHEGNSFGRYSKAVVPLSRYSAREGVTRNDIDRLEKSVGWFASYEDLRRVKGYVIAFKNFSFTNKMWNTLKAVVKKVKQGVVEWGYVVASDRVEVVNIHDAQHEILSSSVSEIAIREEAARRRLLRVFKKHGIG